MNNLQNVFLSTTVQTQTQIDEERETLQKRINILLPAVNIGCVVLLAVTMAGLALLGIDFQKQIIPAAVFIFFFSVMVSQQRKDFIKKYHDKINGLDPIDLHCHQQLASIAAQHPDVGNYLKTVALMEREVIQSELDTIVRFHKQCEYQALLTNRLTLEKQQS